MMNKVVGFLVGLVFLGLFGFVGGWVTAEALNVLAGVLAGGMVTWVGGVLVLASFIWVGFFGAFGAYIISSARERRGPPEDFEEALAKLKALDKAFRAFGDSTKPFGPWG